MLNEQRCCGQKRCEKGKLRKPSASKNQTKEDELLAESLGNENGISYRFAMLRLLMLVGICIPY